MTTQPNDHWPERPSWGLAVFFLLAIVVGISLLYWINYQQAFAPASQ